MSDFSRDKLTVLIYMLCISSIQGQCNGGICDVCSRLVISWLGINDYVQILFQNIHSVKICKEKYIIVSTFFLGSKRCMRLQFEWGSCFRKKITSPNLSVLSLRVPGNFKPITIQSGGHAPEREPCCHDLKGGTLRIFIQICPFPRKKVYAYFSRLPENIQTIFLGILKDFWFS